MQTNSKTTKKSKQKSEILNQDIFESIFEAADHERKITGVVDQFIEATISIAAFLKKTFLVVHFTDGQFFVNLLTEKLWFDCLT